MDCTGAHPEWMKGLLAKVDLDSFSPQPSVASTERGGLANGIEIINNHD